MLIESQARRDVTKNGGRTRPDLLWDPKLAASAQKWAIQLAGRDELEHSQSGENLYASSGMAADHAYVNATEGWLREKSQYWGQPIDDNFAKYGHYTQVRRTTINVVSIYGY